MIGLVKECVETVQYSVMVNGTPWGFFKVGKDIRKGDFGQWDPLGVLFIMIVEVLGRNFLSLLHSGKIQGIWATSTLPPLCSSTICG